MARVALRVLQRLRCPEPQGAEMLQSLQEEFGVSRITHRIMTGGGTVAGCVLSQLSMSKDLSSVKRRMQALARTRSFQTTVGTLAEEFLQDTVSGHCSCSSALSLPAVCVCVCACVCVCVCVCVRVCFVVIQLGLSTLLPP